MNLDDAQRALAGAKAKADEMGLPMCVAVTDEHAYLVAFIRTGDTTLDSIQLAIDKAWTAALIRMDTRELRAKRKKERERAQKRLANRVNLDLPIDLKKRLEILAKKEGVPVMQLFAFLLQLICGCRNIMSALIFNRF
jgi:hypothetical protein